MTAEREQRVLVVDDEPMIRMIAADELESAGFSVLEAATADEALEILQSRRDVGVLFTDVNMPGQLDGLALAELVHDRWPEIKLVVASGRPLQRGVPDASTFLTKPYTGDQLRACIFDAGKP
jgi:CheY-like chemotaxis protein